VVAVSYLLAATVAEVLGPQRARAFWLLRSVGLLAYIVVAAAGNAGIEAMLACESLTMACVLVLWLWAAYRSHPLAPAMLLAIAASGSAATATLASAETLRPVGLDPTSLYPRSDRRPRAALPRRRRLGAAGSRRPVSRRR